MFPTTVIQRIETFLSGKIGKSVQLLSTTPLGGGCINESAKISTSSGNYFVKYNTASKFPGMFGKEALGLQLLDAASEIRVPEVLHHDIAGEYSFLLLEYMSEGTRKPDFWHSFGRSLAALHRHTQPLFGLDHDNFMGSLPQSNRQHADWIRFFIEERLEPQVRIAREKGEISLLQVKQFERLYNRLGGIIPEEKPALLHGDLWNGNYMVDETGNACLIDPAVYYGHREIDIAMTRLFGGFPNEFYGNYHDAFPLEKGWENRIDLFNLYPLLIHVNLFGGGYASQVKNIIQRYS